MRMTRNYLGATALAVCLPLACLAIGTTGLAAGTTGSAASATGITPSQTAPAFPARPQRIMSTNMCSDLLLLMLVPKDRISSITYLAHDPVNQLMPGADEGVRINHGTAEEVVRERPDLILASPWSTPVMRRLGARVGAPVAEIDSANSFADIRRITRQVGDLVGEPERAEQMVAEMDRELARLAATRPARPLDVVVWSGDGSVPGQGTLTDEIISAAGARNIAAKFHDGRYSSYGIEELLAARPEAIMRGEDRYDAPSLQDASAGHPVIRKAFKGRQVTYPASLYTCGIPLSVDAVRQLRATLAQVPAGELPW